jgi:hypothetical protein
VTRAALRSAAIALAIACSGCATEQLRFAALSSEPVPTLGYPKERLQRVTNVSATVSSQIILWIPTNTRTPTLQDAIDSALERGGGKLLVDVEVRHWWVLVPFLYGEEGWTVTGDVVRDLPPE